MIPRRSRGRLHLIIATGDGSRLVSVAVPRWSVKAGAVASCLALAAVGMMAADWRALNASRLDSATFEARLVAERRAASELLAAERQTTADLRAQVDTIRAELATWPALHARIVSALGRPTPGAAAAPTSGTAADVSNTVRQLTGTLRQLAGIMIRFGGVLAQMPTSWPVRAAINSEFGMRASPWTGDREFHRGIDLAAGYGAAVHAPAAGAIVFTGPRSDYGLTVIVDHGSEVRTLYGHLSRVAVNTGERVQRGQVLGESGNTGRSTGAHLHYEVQVAGRPVNPRAYLWE